MLSTRVMTVISSPLLILAMVLHYEKAWHSTYACKSQTISKCKHLFLIEIKFDWAPRDLMKAKMCYQRKSDRFKWIVRRIILYVYLCVFIYGFIKHCQNLFSVFADDVIKQICSPQESSVISKENCPHLRNKCNFVLKLHCSS
jgi:hypothetical protein